MILGIYTYLSLLSLNPKFPTDISEFQEKNPSQTDNAISKRKQTEVQSGS